MMLSVNLNPCRTISHHDYDTNNVDVSSGYGFKNIHTLSQCEDSSTSNDMYLDV